MKKKRKTATQLSPLDLRLIFLAEIRRTIPEAIYELDQTRNISQWAKRFGLNVPWILTVAMWVKDSAQGQMDRLDLSTDPLGNALFLDEGAEPVDEYQRRVLALWDKHVGYQIAWIRSVEKMYAAAGLELSPVTVTKRDAPTHCKMLLLYLATDLTDEQIAKTVKYREVTNIGARRRELAKLLGIKLPSKRGRPKK